VHNYHTENFYFHANGDPIPSDVLIQPVDGLTKVTFRASSEEIITFCAAVRLEAVGRTTTLRTTRFELDGPNVTLRILTPKDKDDALNMVVPLADLQEFVMLALQRRFELYVEECFNGDRASDVMAGIGMFTVFMQSSQSPAVTPFQKA
jgi:hypothetical protein